MKKNSGFLFFLFITVTLISCRVDKLNEQLIEAVYSNDIILVRELIDSGADIQGKSNSNESAVTAAVRNGNLEMLKYFSDTVPADEQKSELAVVSFFLSYIEFIDTAKEEISSISSDANSSINKLEKRISELERKLPALFGKLDRKVNSALEKSAIEEFLLKEMGKGIYTSEGNLPAGTESGLLNFSDLLGEN